MQDFEFDSPALTLAGEIDLLGPVHYGKQRSLEPFGILQHIRDAKMLQNTDTPWSTINTHLLFPQYTGQLNAFVLIPSDLPT